MSDPKNIPTPNKQDFTGGDHSFSMWFKIMWKNGFIFLFTVNFIALVLQVFNFPLVFSWLVEAWHEGVFEGLISTAGNLIPITASSLIAYKAFYQYWRDLQNGISR